MKIGVAASDFHITHKIPRFRTETFVEDQYDKVEQILWLCKDYADQGHKVYLLNSGDMFDTARIPRWLLSRYLSLFNVSTFLDSFAHIACAGQHDQLFHSRKLDDTSIYALYSSGCIQRFGPGIKVLDWGAELDTEYGGTLVAHICCTVSHNEFIDYSITAKELLRKTKAKVIVTGDYHHAHHYQRDGRLIVNPGSITRLASDEVDRRPSVYVVDLDAAEIIEQVFLEVRPPAEAFLVGRIGELKDEDKKKQERQDRFEDYLQKVKEKKIKPDFDKVLSEVVKDMAPAEEVKQMIEEYVNG